MMRSGSSGLDNLVFVGAFLCLCANPVAAQEFRDEFQAVTPTNFDSGGEISRKFHLNAESYLRMSTILSPTGSRNLEADLASTIASTTVVHRNGESTFAEYVAQDDLIDGVIVLLNGRIVFEAYPHMVPRQRHFAWSVTKVVASTALAVLVEQGRVRMGDPIEQYLPTLADSGWAGISIRDIANMASGIDCLDSDGYQDPSTCVYTMEESLGITAPTGRDPDLVQHLRSMTRHAEPGHRYEYVSANTNVLALLIETVTGKQFSQAVSELIWQPIGAETDAMMAISKSGFSYGSGGLHARLRDIARFGQVYTAPELAGVITPDTVRKIQGCGVAFPEEKTAEHREELGDDLPLCAGWQWEMIWADGAMYKSGYSGQGLYVYPARDLVIAWFGTGLDYDEVHNEMLPVSRQIARSLR